MKNVKKLIANSAQTTENDWNFCKNYDEILIERDTTPLKCDFSKCVSGQGWMLRWRFSTCLLDPSCREVSAGWSEVEVIGPSFQA